MVVTAAEAVAEVDGTVAEAVVMVVVEVGGVGVDGTGVGGAAAVA